jgi:hypothetical protein
MPADRSLSSQHCDKDVTDSDEQLPNRPGYGPVSKMRDLPEALEVRESRGGAETTQEALGALNTG